MMRINDQIRDAKLPPPEGRQDSKLCRAGATRTSTPSSCPLRGVRERLLERKTASGLVRSLSRAIAGGVRSFETRAGSTVQPLAVSRGRWALGELGCSPGQPVPQPLLASPSVLSYLLVYSRKREAVRGSDFSRGFVFASN